MYLSLSDRVADPGGDHTAPDPGNKSDPTVKEKLDLNPAKPDLS